MRTAQMFRVFFNRRGAPKHEAWSIDAGQGTDRRHFRDIDIKTRARSVYNGKEPDWENPIAWFEVKGVLNVRGDRASITRGGIR